MNYQNFLRLESGSTLVTYFSDSWIFNYFIYTHTREWWDESSSKGCGPLHDMNPIRVDFIRRLYLLYCLF